MPPDRSTAEPAAPRPGAASVSDRPAAPAAESGIVAAPPAAADEARAADLPDAGAEPAAGAGEPPLAAPDITLFQTLFELSSDAQYVLDPATHRFVLVNQSWELLFGYTVAEMDATGLTSHDLLSEGEHKKIDRRARRRVKPNPERYHLRALTRWGETRELELAVRRIRWRGRPLDIGSVRDVSSQRERERETDRLHMDLTTANNAILALTEKLESVPRMTTEILGAGSAEEILNVAARHLASPSGFGFERVTFYFIREGRLVSRASSTGRADTSYQLDGASDLARAASGKKEAIWQANQLFFPLRSRGEVVGVLAATLARADGERLEASPRARDAIVSVMTSISQNVALAIDHRELFEEVERQSVIDPLTALYNRRYLDRKLVEEFRRARRYGRDLTLVVVDLDHFKAVNDACGHAQGDAVLKGVAGLIRERFREQDVVCRFGGDEFVLLMPETAADGARHKIDGLCAAAREVPFENPSDPATPVRITLSVGITDMRSNPENHEQFWDFADRALFASKRAGRDRVTLYSPDLAW
ncbi:MAG: diguanylate cyclase [Planctomycetes bacterium]|nr:diguanylate cyclase [Planctomycetota bacterium]